MELAEKESIREGEREERETKRERERKRKTFSDWLL